MESGEIYAAMHSDIVGLDILATDTTGKNIIGQVFMCSNFLRCLLCMVFCMDADDS